MGFRVLYHLNTSNIKGIPEEARWAESIGYDGLCTEETGHDPLFPLVLAATTTSRVTLEPRVAIAFPRSPMVFAYAANGLAEPLRRAFPLGLGHAGQGPHRAALLHGMVVPRPASAGNTCSLFTPSGTLGRTAHGCHTTASITTSR